jgi:hypothetical protein
MPSDFLTNISGATRPRLAGFHFFLTNTRGRINMASEKLEYTAELSDLGEVNIGMKAEHADHPDGQAPPSQDELRAVRRKIDWRLMPVMVGTYGLQFYGKRSFSNIAMIRVLMLRSHRQNCAQPSCSLWYSHRSGSGQDLKDWRNDNHQYSKIFVWSVDKTPCVRVTRLMVKTVGMAFYCGYILGVYPITFLAQKYRPGKVCAAIIFFWGIVELL